MIVCSFSRDFLSLFFADVGRSSSVHVSVRSLPRCDEIPSVTCGHTNNFISPNLASTATGSSTAAFLSDLSPILSVSGSFDSGKDSPSNSSPVPLTSGYGLEKSGTASEDNSPSSEEGKLPIAVALEAKDPAGSLDLETDLRKTLVKSRLAECHQQEKLSRSDSMDSMLGDSLLDPPQCLQKIPPKRYQSPSRCGSPSLEAPDHLLFGSSNKSSGKSKLLIISI